MSPAAAELQYVILCQQIEGYGEEIFNAKVGRLLHLDAITSQLLLLH